MNSSDLTAECMIADSEGSVTICINLWCLVRLRWKSHLLHTRAKIAWTQMCTNRSQGRQKLYDSIMPLMHQFMQTEFSKYMDSVQRDNKCSQEKNLRIIRDGEN